MITCPKCGGSGTVLDPRDASRGPAPFEGYDLVGDLARGVLDLADEVERLKGQLASLVISNAEGEPSSIYTNAVRDSAGEGRRLSAMAR